MSGLRKRTKELLAELGGLSRSENVEPSPCDRAPSSANSSDDSHILKHRPEPIHRLVTPEEYAMGYYDAITKVCRFCNVPIQKRGLFRRWRHVQ